MATKPRFNPARGTWQVQYWADGKWHRETVGRAPARWKKGDPEPTKIPPEVFARADKLAKAEEQSRKEWGRGIPDSLATFLRDHLSRYAKENTREAAGYAVDSFLAWCDERGIVRRSQVDAEICADFLDFIGRTLSIGTATMRRAYLAAAWGRLVRRKKIADNPWTGLEPIGQQRTKPKNAWTEEEFRKLLEACKEDRYEWLRDVLIFGVNTGLRIGSMMQVEWGDWQKPETDAEGFGFIVVRTEICKTKGYKVPVSRKLNELLWRRFGKHHPRFILTGKAGNPLKARQHTQVSITLACGRAELPRPVSPNHHLRRTFGRWAVLGHLTGRPVPLYVVSRWMGHADIKMTLKYLDLVQEDSINWMLPQDPT